MRSDPKSLSFPMEGLLAILLAVIPISLGATPDEVPFTAENKVAMAKMMADMDVTPSGDVDKDFVAMMVPHHQGAIEMAQALLRHGHNERLKRLAQEIIVTQQEEIATMRLALGQPLPPSTPAPTQPPSTAGVATPSTVQHPMQEHQGHSK